MKEVFRLHKLTLMAVDPVFEFKTYEEMIDLMKKCLDAGYQVKVIEE